MIPSNNTFITYDISLAGTLVSNGFSVDSLDKTDPKKIGFYFYRKDGLDEIIQAFWSKQLCIEPQLFFTNIKMLKNRIYSE